MMKYQRSEEIKNDIVFLFGNEQVAAATAEDSLRYACIATFVKSVSQAA